MRIYVKAETWGEVTREADSNDRWDRNDTYTDWNFTGLSLSEGHDYIETDKKFKLDQRAHCVVAVYSTGDSFGSDNSACCEVLAVYDNLEDAEKARELVELDDDGPLVLPDGYEIRYKPWTGYFESLDYATVISANLEK